MKNTSSKRRSAAGRQSKIRPGAKAATEPKKQRVEHKKMPAQILKDSEIRYRRLFEAAQDGILILDARTGAIDDVNPYLIDMLGYSRTEFVKKKLWEVGAFKDVDASQIAFNVLQEKGYICYENLPLRAKDGQLIQVEFVSNVYLAGARKVIQCNIRDITERKQADEEIKFLAKFPDENPYPVLRINKKGLILYANPASRALLEDWKTAIGREASSFWRKKVTEVLANRSNQVVDTSIGARIISIVLIPIIEAGYVNLYGSDITERKRAEEKLHEDEARLRLAMDAARGGAWEWDLQTNENIWSEELWKVYGLEPHSCEPSFEAWLQTIHPDDRAGAAQAVQKAAREATELNAEWRAQDRDGTERWLMSRGQPIFNTDGQVVRYIGIVLDITNRKKMEDELREAHDELELQVQLRTAALSQANMLLQTLLDNMPDYIYFKDAESRFIKNSRSHASSLGLNDPSQMLGKTDFDFFPHAPRSYAAEQEIMRSGQPMVDFEEWVVWPDGHGTWVSTTKAPLRDHEDKIIGTFGISRDITDRKRNEEALKKARDELETFSYSVSHDLRAPLRGIDGWSLALLEDYGGLLDERGREYIKRVRSETQHMGELIDDLLQLSRITRSEMNTERVDLSAIAQTIAARLQESEPGRQVEFTIQKGLNVQGDAHLLEVALNNLLDNAFKFTSKTPNPHIKFGQIEVKGEHVFFVRDNGVGFDMAFAKKLFGAFQRMHKASEFPGTGIGLATVQRIIHRHGGRIWAESAVNEGATFLFTLKEVL